MSVLAFLIPIALFLGAIGLASFFWALKTGQFEDPEGSAERILLDDDIPQSSEDDLRISR